MLILDDKLMGDLNYIFNVYYKLRFIDGFDRCLFFLYNLLTCSNKPKKGKILLFIRTCIRQMSIRGDILRILLCPTHDRATRAADQNSNKTSIVVSR